MEKMKPKKAKPKDPKKITLVRGQARPFPTHHLKKSFDKGKNKSIENQAN